MGKAAQRTLTDRYKVSFPVVTRCRHCYNIIYNSAPLSLHKTCEKLLKQSDCRLSFTTETGEETQRILRFYESLIKETGQKAECPVTNYTTGHEKRGVE